MFEKVSKIDSQQNNAFSRSYAVRNVEKMCVCVCVLSRGGKYVGAFACFAISM